MSLRKIIAVARREYAEMVKTKTFLVGVLLMPGIIVGLIFLSTRISMDVKRSGRAIRVAVVDATARIAPEMLRVLENQKSSEDKAGIELEVAAPAESGIEGLKRRVREGSLYGVIEVPATVLQGSGEAVFTIRSSGLDGRPSEVRRLVNNAVKRIRFAEAGVDPQRIEELSREIPIRQQDIHQQQGQKSDRTANMMTPFAFAFLLFMSVFGVSQGLLTSVIEEKSSRVVEVLLSALSPFELMCGKILGMAAVGLTMVVLWSAAGYVTAVAKDVQYLVQVAHVGQFLIYYVLGFLLISSLLAAVGSACNTLKDSQPMLAPLTLLLIVPLMFWFHIVQQPNSTLATALALVPPMTPFIMMLRLTSLEGTVPLWQQIAAPVWLALWMLVTMWAAGRVFRVGLLMYGKPPSLRELTRWVRYR